MIYIICLVVKSGPSCVPTNLGDICLDNEQPMEKACCQLQVSEFFIENYLYSPNTQTRVELNSYNYYKSTFEIL